MINDFQLNCVLGFKLALGIRKQYSIKKYDKILYGIFFCVTFDDIRNVTRTALLKNNIMT